jgi:hypothetical protein
MAALSNCALVLPSVPNALCTLLGDLDFSALDHAARP